MKLPYGDLFGRRRPGFSGRLMVDTVRGVTRVRAWPKKRGKIKSPLQQHWVDWFRAANFAAKYASSYDISRAKELTEGTRWYPRDLLLKAMRGRLFWWTDENGQNWFPAAIVSDITDTLDVLADKIGDILVRASDRWRAPPAGAEGDVLTYHPASPPDWQPPVAPPAASPSGALATRTGAQTISRLTMTPIEWQTEQYDTDAFMDLAASLTKFVIPAGFSKCRLTANIRWATSQVGERILRFNKNGVLAPGLGDVVILPPAFNVTVALTSALIPCVEGDDFECVVWHNHNTTLSVNSNDESTFFGIQAFP